jgi:uncharacterized NAD(P)/FAD-binding protein YdhS
VVVGGGVSGASFALQLSRASAQCGAIHIVEPAPRVGPGLAYSTTDPDHRLNGTLDSHVLDPARLTELRTWCHDNGILSADPEAQLPSGATFIRRHDFGRYVADQIQRNAVNPHTGTTITHCRDTAVQWKPSTAHPAGTVLLASGRRLPADVVVVATGNPLPRLQHPFVPEHLANPRIIANPLNGLALQGVPLDARVLVVGTGLTALDVLSTLVRRAHTGPILAVSRRGLRPRPQPPEVLGPAPMPPRTSGPTPLEQVMAPIPPFVQALGDTYSMAGLYGALRSQIRRDSAQGKTWHAAFDLFRDAVWRIWPRVPLAEKQKFLRRMRTWYDVHRFRSPPHNDALVQRAQDCGTIQFVRARLTQVAADPDGGPVQVALTANGAITRSAFDLVINCSGLDAGNDHRQNPFLQSAQAQGLLVTDPTGLGFHVDASCRAISATGQACPHVRVIGPPTLGAHGDSQGVRFIAVQIYRMLPDVLDTLSGQAFGGRDNSLADAAARNKGLPKK